MGCHSLLQGSSCPRDWTWVSCIADRFFIVWATTGVHPTQSSPFLLDCSQVTCFVCAHCSDLVWPPLAVAWTTAKSSLSSYYPVTIISSFLHFMFVGPLVCTRSCQDPWEMAVFHGGHSPLLLAALKPLVPPHPTAGTQGHLSPLPSPLSGLWSLCTLLPLGLGTCCSCCLEHCSSSVSTCLVCSSVPASGEHLWLPLVPGWSLPLLCSSIAQLLPHASLRFQCLNIMLPPPSDCTLLEGGLDLVYLQGINQKEGGCQVYPFPFLWPLLSYSLSPNLSPWKSPPDPCAQLPLTSLPPSVSSAVKALLCRGPCVWRWVSD